MGLFFGSGGARMINPEKLSAIKGKDPVINTFTWEGLRDSPQSVEESYSAHAITHMSLGDTSKYVTRLKQKILKNKFSSIGAIVGPYGYGKTSTAIHIWKEMQDTHDVLSVPPFEWLKLSDIIEAVTAWINFKLNQSSPQFINDLNQIYQQYRDKSLEEVAKELGLSIKKAQSAYEAGRINLEIDPAHVISFLMEVCQLCTNKAGFSGLAVFVDELQETADKYPSLRAFQTDLFAFADKIPTKEANFAIIFTMPDTLEANINTTRPDIIHRLQQSSLYIRVEAIYGREFPKQLWEKYAEIFDFEDNIHDPINEDTLDSIGQIASRRDLGAGPRTVINALVEAIKHYEGYNRSYSPFDLVNGFLDNKISFEERGKFSQSVRTTLEIKQISSRKEYEQVIKLLAAFPLGCSRERIKEYNMIVAFDQLAESNIYGNIIYPQAEGYTLRSLLEEEVSAEPTYFRLVRDDFIRSYNPDKAHARQAMHAFYSHVLESLFEAGRKDQLDKWQWSKSKELAGGDKHICGLTGTFLSDYPYRDVEVNLAISPHPSSPEWGLIDAEMKFSFELIYDIENEKSNKILFTTDEKRPNEVVFHLNLMRIPTEVLNIPRIHDLYPTERMTPLFMLSLLQYLNDIDEKIPTPEKTGELKVVKDRLVQYSTQVLMGEGLDVDERLDIHDVGFALIKSIFKIMCQSLYPHYQTLITSSQWKKHEQFYVAALRDPGISPSILRGKEPLKTTKDHITRLFGQTSKQAANTLITQNLSSLAKLEWGKGRTEGASLLFTLHPLEHEILQLLRDSPHAEDRKEGKIRFLPALEVFEKSKQHGYKNDEIIAIIELLREREYVTYNQNTNSIEQLIRSVDDLRDSLYEGLLIIESAIDKLKIIGEFDPERQASRIEQVRTGAKKLKNPEDAEDLLITLHTIENGLRRYINKTAEITITDLRTFKNKIQPILTAGVPDDLTTPIAGGTAPWSSSLEDCRQRIRRRYDEMINRYKQEARKIEQFLLEIGPIETNADYLVQLIKFGVDIQSEADQLNNQRAAILGYQTNLREWKKLLQRSNQIHQDALTAKASFNETQFLVAAEAIWSEITNKFDEAPIDALADHKEFFEDIIDLERNIGEWQRKRRETFLAEKQALEESLRLIGDERPMLKTNFDPYLPPEEIRETLREEALEHVIDILDQYEQRIKQLHNEVIYAERVQQLSGVFTPENVEEALINLNSIKKKSTTKQIHTTAGLEELSQEFIEFRDKLLDMTESVQSFITKRPPESPSENELLQFIQNSVSDTIRGADLKEVILNIVAENPDFELEHLMQDLESLFKKNQVMIRLQPRR